LAAGAGPIGDAPQAINEGTSNNAANAAPNRRTPRS